MYPADGMRRLLHMEKTSGIWTQKMILRLDREWVTIQDFENGEVVERFPLNLILEPTAFTSLDPKDLYNNIFIFVVGEDPLNRDPPEMHIFQCVGVSSELVTEDMKMYMAGNYRPSNPSRIPPPPNKPPPEPPLNGVCYFLWLSFNLVISCIIIWRSRLTTQFSCVTLTMTPVQPRANAMKRTWRYWTAASTTSSASSPGYSMPPQLAASSNDVESTSPISYLCFIHTLSPSFFGGLVKIRYSSSLVGFIRFHSNGQIVL